MDTYANEGRVYSRWVVYLCPWRVFANLGNGFAKTILLSRRRGDLLLHRATIITSQKILTFANNCNDLILVMMLEGTPNFKWDFGGCTLFFYQVSYTYHSSLPSTSTRYGCTFKIFIRNSLLIGNIWNLFGWNFNSNGCQQKLGKKSLWSLHI